MVGSQRSLSASLLLARREEKGSVVRRGYSLSYTTAVDDGRFKAAFTFAKSVEVPREKERRRSKKDDDPV